MSAWRPSVCPAFSLSSLSLSSSSFNVATLHTNTHIVQLCFCFTQFCLSSTMAALANLGAEAPKFGSLSFGAKQLEALRNKTKQSNSISEFRLASASACFISLFVWHIVQICLFVLLVSLAWPWVASSSSSSSSGQLPGFFQFASCTL